MEGQHRPLFEAAAAALEAGPPAATAPLDPQVRALLEGLGLGPAVGRAASAGDAALLRAAARFPRLFRLRSEDAPGLVAFGAEVDPAAAFGSGDGGGAAPPIPLASASGVGLTAAEAFRACAGEGVEFLAGLETPADRAALRGPPAAPGTETADPALAALVAALPWRGGGGAAAAGGGGGPTGWVPARRMTDGRPVLVPREIALRLPPGTGALDPPPWPPGLGCAAGPGAGAAALHALLELIERDAVALWWRGGRPARALALEDPALAEAGAVLAALRQDRAGREGRRSWLLDISTEFGVPVLAALSFGPGGAGFCCGFAARPGRAAAARAAVLEMAQMELAVALVRAKRAARGEAALNPRDRLHLRRHAAIHAARCALVHPRLPPAAAAEAALEGEAAPLEAILARLAGRGGGLAPILVDLTRPALGIAAARVLCPGLEPEPSTLGPGPRLRAAIAETGGGDGQTGAVALM